MRREKKGQEIASHEHHHSATVGFGEFENPGILKKKRSFFRVKQSEAGQVDLAGVDFRFREICIDRSAGNQIGCDPIEYIRARIVIGLYLVRASDIPG